MEPNDVEAILDLVRARLSGVDHITRREILKALLKNSAFVGFLTGAGAGALAPATAHAEQRRFISSRAATAAGPDHMFTLSRTLLMDGLNAFLADALLDLAVRIPAEAEAFMNARPVEVPRTDDAPCPDVQTCSGHSCSGGFECGIMTCGEDGCNPGLSCTGHTCGDHNCGQDGCAAQSCPVDRRDNVGDVTPFLPSEFLRRYGAQPFVRELRELFGQNVGREIEGMIRTKTTLRGRGLIQTGTPPAVTLPPGGALRDLPGARLQRVPPAVPPPAAPAPPKPGTPR